MPVPTKLRPFLDKIKDKYQARPLQLYRGDNIVSAQSANDIKNDILREALVEVHFELHHFNNIWKPKHDSRHTVHDASRSATSSSLSLSGLSIIPAQVSA